jgi:hypothetical protein
MAFDQRKIEFAFPTQTLYLQNSVSGVSSQKNSGGGPSFSERRSKGQKQAAKWRSDERRESFSKKNRAGIRPCAVSLSKNYVFRQRKSRPAGLAK